MSSAALVGSAALVAAALAMAADVAPVPAAALKVCAAISAPSKRLECYDRLAASLPTSPALAPTLAPAAVPAPVAAGAAAAASPPPVASAPPTAPPKESFGLYAPEHPAAPPPAASLTARVASLSVSATGYPTVTLEGGQVWELDSIDPVLASGDSVTIKRAAFGSFLMTTTKGRTHRVHRLR